MNFFKVDAKAGMTNCISITKLKFWLRYGNALYIYSSKMSWI